MLADPALRETLEREGILNALGPAAGPIQERTDALVLAQGGGQGALGILSGHLETDDIIASLTAPGTEVESEIYGGTEIWKAKVVFQYFALDVPISSLDDTTTVFAVSFSPETPALDVVRAALDAANGSRPSFLSDHTVRQLIEAVPLGFSMVISARDCGPPEGPEGCTGSAISQIKEGDAVISNAAFSFSTPAMARAALPALKEEVLQDVRESLVLLEAKVQGNIALVRVRGDTSTAILGIGD